MVFLHTMEAGHPRAGAAGAPWRRWLSSTDDGEGPAGNPGRIPPSILPLSGRKAMVAEDEFFVGLELVQMLESAGAEVSGPASSLADAEAIAAADGIDIAVIDVNLNGDYALDLGVDLHKRGVRVVFATAYADDTRLFTGEAAAIPRLGKPVSARALLRALLRET